jgi:hypothetical protein
MLRNTIIAAVLLLLLTPASARVAVNPDDLGEGSELFWKALDELGLEPGEVRIDLQDLGFYNRDKYYTQLLTTFFDNPWKISPYTHMLSGQLLAAQSSLPDIVTSTQSRINQGVRLTLIGNPLEPYEEQVAEHGERNLAVALGKLTGERPEDYLGDSYYSLPPEVRDAAALFCFTMPEVASLREAAIGEPLRKLGLEPEDVFLRCLEWAVELPGEDESTRYMRDEAILMEALMDNVDFARLNTGGTLLALCVERMASTLSECGSLDSAFRFTTATPYGEIVICGGGDDEYVGGLGTLLVLDTSGDDTYRRLGGTQSYAQCAAVLIDLSGDDTYANTPDQDYRLRLYFDEDHPDYTGEDYLVCYDPTFGAGVLGYGLLLDCEGDDSYDCQFIGQGCGVFGNGMLFDQDGDDRYIGIGSVQGSGWFGTGLLVDNAGSDHYELYRYGQGFGFTGGVGLLLDGSGDDKYIANNTDIVYDGPHSPVINLNLAQGFGYGRRDDYGEGHSWAGGVGLLIDGGVGDDTYDCGIYALGCSYWAAVGILVDQGGNDSYMSAHYTLGAPPHYAVGVFIDDAGDDVYYGYLRQAIGHGRDWSLGWFEDGGGNDWYQGGHMSIGCGDVNSLGFFWDKGGDDTYLLKGQGFGQTTTAASTMPSEDSPGSLRLYQLNLGLFIDGGGFDRYLEVPEELPFTGDVDALPAFAMCGNGMSWRRGDSMDAPRAYSIGIDAE